MDLSLRGKQALICGSSKGIGLAIAQALSHLGATVILTGRNKETLLAAQDSMKGKSHVFQVDLSVAASREELLSWILKSKFEPEILINNAGGPPSSSFQGSQPKDLQTALDTHLFAMDQLSRALLPGMLATGYGRIVNIVSVTARVPLANMLLSNTVRGAVISWSKTVANEVASQGVTVNNILPGYTRTTRIIDLTESMARNQNLTPKEIEANWIQQIPMKRLAEPHEIANVAAFLCSPAASFVTGTSIPVDGGWTPSI